jgi:7-cyano-7-deazaguanine synthase in queuosine biosynthesis
MGIDYGWEKFFNTLSYAVGSAASPQERLESVMVGTNHLERDSFPDDETREAFEEMLKATTSRAAQRDEGTIRATTSRMTNDEAAKWLTKAFKIFAEIAEAYGAQQH